MSLLDAAAGQVVLRPQCCAATSHSLGLWLRGLCTGTGTGFDAWCQCLVFLVDSRTPDFEAVFAPQASGLRVHCAGAVLCAGGLQLQYLVYETEQVVEFTTPEQKAVKRSGLAALRPSGDVSEATAQLIQRMRRMHDEKFGELGQFRFVVAHISMDANGGGIGSGSGAAGAVTRLFGALKASVSRGVLLYVTMEPIPEHEEVMKLLTTTFQVVTRQDLWPEAEKLYPEHEFMAALEQGVARDAALYVGLSSSPFSQFVFQTRCFAPGPIVEAGAALVQPRPTVFYDRNTTAAPCQVL